VGNENHSIINLSIEELEVRLSAWWMLEGNQNQISVIFLGKGLVKEAVLKGVRGTIDRQNFNLKFSI
jgi:hypothetical protein